MGQHIIYFIRHGQYVTDNSQAMAGHLTPLGRQQARRTAKRLAELPISAIYHSDMTRAKETAAIIAEAMPRVPMHSARVLREMTPPVPSRLRRLWGKESSGVQSGVAQAEALLKRFFKPCRTKENRVDVLVAHGNLIRYVVRRLLRDKPESWLSLGTSNCGVTVLVVGKDVTARYLISYNDVGHLPLELQSMM